MRIVPKTSVTGDAKQVLCVLDWALRNGVQLSTVSVGTCSVQVVPATATAVKQEERGPSRESLYDRFGGPALSSVTRDVVPGAEYQPVIGRGE